MEDKLPSVAGTWTLKLHVGCGGLPGLPGRSTQPIAPDGWRTISGLMKAALCSDPTCSGRAPGPPCATPGHLCEQHSHHLSTRVHLSVLFVCSSAELEADLHLLQEGGRSGGSWSGCAPCSRAQVADANKWADDRRLRWWLWASR